ncbi:unnamed protein product [Lactuca saligna]|uniref:Uncharacterized protein n=1 Tax=Lactuca saligna TaxID=75948 RepID=A0AA35YIQ1_LACSI|nr:unnamed protein product [Lactuca saligna]
MYRVTSSTTLPSTVHKIKYLDQFGSHSVSLPTHLKVVSAMKGSREKRAVAPPVTLRLSDKMHERHDDHGPEGYMNVCGMEMNNRQWSPIF